MSSSFYENVTCYYESVLSFYKHYGLKRLPNKSFVVKCCYLNSFSLPREFILVISFSASEETRKRSIFPYL